MAGALTTEQLAELQRLAERYKDLPAPPMATLVRLADDWDSDYSLLAREYTGFTMGKSNNRTERRTEQRQADQRRTDQRRDQPTQPLSAPRAPGPLFTNPPGKFSGPAPVPAVSPVAGVRAAPGTIYEQGKNWVLIDARIRNGYEPREIAMVLEPPLSYADYRRVEDGEFNPSADQQVQLCQLLGVKLEDAFVIAGPRQTGKRRGRGFIKGFALVEILMARRQLTVKELAEAVEAATSVKVSSILIGRIKRGEFQPAPKRAAKDQTPKQAAREQDERDQVAALALFFEIPEEWVTRQVPPELVKMAASNTAKLHQAIRQAFGQLQQIDEDRPHLLTSGGDSK